MAANATSSGIGTPKDDGFVMPAIIIAGSLGGLCFLLICCYGLLVFRRRRRKQGQELAGPIDNSQDLDCVILKVEEIPQESPRARQDVDSVVPDVEAHPQELPGGEEPNREMPSRPGDGNANASAPSNAIESDQDQWNLQLSADAPEALPASSTRISL
eukprot:TRINITY_DN6705_c0_g1_i2.p1 TRINITY_DN6705_c0_g1~~TRINITY_DN6705_c0_g1_i2.p1  ORF type:complete len:158 (-),score=19.13 TRINITY_DN6705_c0_g1_i2:294-767(-)